jgi:hypothetical protein
MTVGFVELHTPALRSMFARSSPVTLCFAASETFEFEIVAPAERRIAYACRCGCGVFTGDSWAE